MDQVNNYDLDTDIIKLYLGHKTAKDFIMRDMELRSGGTSFPLTWIKNRVFGN